jgi:hypothetical protein
MSKLYSSHLVKYMRGCTQLLSRFEVGWLIFLHSWVLLYSLSKMPGRIVLEERQQIGILSERVESVDAETVQVVIDLDNLATVEAPLIRNVSPENPCFVSVISGVIDF